MPPPVVDGQGRAVLITGASSGFGRRLTELLSENDWYVYAGARRPEDIAALNAMKNVHALKLDVTVQGDIDAAVAEVKAGGKGLFGLVNNAGVAQWWQYECAPEWRDLAPEAGRQAAKGVAGQGS